MVKLYLNCIKGPLEAVALREFVAQEFGEQPDVPQQEQPIVEAQKILVKLETTPQGTARIIYRIKIM